MPRSRAFFDFFVSAVHENECVTSCHRCLREFGNMAHHPLLDWRLGLDMIRLALDPNAQIDLAYSWWGRLMDRTARPFFEGLNLTQVSLGGLVAGLNTSTNEAVILTHPLWDRNPSNFRPEVASAFAAAERRGMTPLAYSVFRAVRFPYEYKEA